MAEFRWRKNAGAWNYEVQSLPYNIPGVVASDAVDVEGIGAMVSLVGAVGSAVMIVFAGQSNGISVGATSPADVDYTYGGKAKIWNPNTSVFASYVPDSNSSPQFTDSNAALWGPEAEFLRQYCAANPTVTVYVVKYCVGGTSLAQGGTTDWNPASVGKLNDTLKSHVAAARANLAAASITAPVIGEFWTQGEADAQDSTWASAYGTNLTALISDHRTAFLGSAPFIFARLATGRNALPYIPAVQDGERAVAQASGLARIVYLDDIPASTALHPGNSGIRLTGSRYYQSLIGTLAPTFLSLPYSSVAENSALSYPIVVMEPAALSIVGGADSARFGISGSNLTMTAKDYEVPTDADTNNIYQVTVRATAANGQTTDQTINVTVTNVTEGGTGYEGEADALIGRLTGSYTTGEKDAINAWFVAVKAAGAYAKLETFVTPHLMKNDHDKLLDWVRNTSTYVNNGADTSGAVFSSDGTGTKNIASGLNLVGLTKAGLQNLWISAGITAYTAGATEYLFGQDTSGAQVLLVAPTTTSWGLRLGNSTQPTITITAGDQIGRWSFNRDPANPNVLTYSRNGATRSSVSSSAVAYPTTTTNLALFRGGSSYGGPNSLSYFAFGGSMTAAQEAAFDAATATFLAA